VCDIIAFEQETAVTDLRWQQQPSVSDKIWLRRRVTITSCQRVVGLKGACWNLKELHGTPALGYA
jgi:hypothetical protein